MHLWLGLPLIIWYIFGVEGIALVIFGVFMLLELKKWTKVGVIAATFYTASGDKYTVRVNALEAEGGIEKFRHMGHTYIVPQIDDRFAKEKRDAARKKKKVAVSEPVTVPALPANSETGQIITLKDADNVETKVEKTALYRPIYRERINMFITVPHAVYIEGRGDPVDMLDMGRHGVPVELLDILGEHHIMSDTFSELDRDRDKLLLFAIAGVALVVILVGFGVYKFTGDKIGKVSEQINAAAMLQQQLAGAQQSPLGTK